MVTVSVWRARREKKRARQQMAIYVEVNVSLTPCSSKGADLYMDVPVSITDAALSKEVEIPTLDGKVKIKVAEGTQACCYGCGAGA